MKYIKKGMINKSKFKSDIEPEIIFTNKCK